MQCTALAHMGPLPGTLTYVRCTALAHGVGMQQLEYGGSVGISDVHHISDRLWGLHSGEFIGICQGHRDSVYAVALSKVP